MVGTFHSRTASTKDDWQTPLHIVHSLGRFELDPCANDAHPLRCAATGYTKAHDGLRRPWGQKRVFLNPPYGRAARGWIERLADHGNGIALIPPRMGAAWFQRTVLETANAILFLRGRIDFIDPNTGKPQKENNADSCLIAWGHRNVQALRECGLPGALWVIR